MAEDRINVNNTDNPAGYSGKGASEIKIDINGVVKELATAIEDSIAGVSQIIAGDNITIDPVGGTGAVTITGSGGATLTDLANDPDTTTGLTYGYKAGNAQSISGEIIAVAAGTVGPLPDDTADVLIYLDFEGNVQFTTSTIVQQCAIRLALVTTAAGEITVINDQRTFLNNKAKFFQSTIVDGGFVSASGLDLTVGEGNSGILFPGGFGVAMDSTVTLTDDALNYVFFIFESPDDGNCELTANTTGWPVNCYPVGKATTAAGQVTVYDDFRPFGTVPPVILTKVTTAQFDKTNSDTLENIPGLSIDVTVDGGTYAFEAILYTTSDVATGVKVAIAGGATATSIIYEGTLYAAGITVATGTTRATALGTAVADLTTTTVARIEITGTIVVDVHGALNVQFAENTAVAATTSSVLVGSKFTVTRVS